MADETETDHQVRPFAAWLRELRGGVFHDELSCALNELTEAVAREGKPGQLDIKLRLKPTARGQHAVITVADQIVLKVPQPETDETFFFVDDGSNLTRDNPYQQSFNLQPVSETSTETKEDHG